MTLKILSSPPPEPADVVTQIESAIREAIPGAEIQARGLSPGHFAIEVVSEVFAGRSRVQQQQLVYGAITPLLSGDSPPVHAVDRLVTRTPDGA